MNRLGLAGLGLLGVGAAGYAVGTAAAYPGRAFSVTAVMIGITLLAMSRTEAGEAR